MFLSCGFEVLYVSHRRCHPIRFPVLVLLIPLVAGCQPTDEIQRHEVPKRDAIQLAVSDDDVPQEVGEPTDRVLGAMVMQGDRAWFFKGVGKLQQFKDGVTEQFDQLVASLRFDNGPRPTWELPEGWSEEAGSGMRVANLRVDELEFSVTPLPLRGGDERGYLVSNINRWRRQLSLGPLSSSELTLQTRKISTADGLDATLVDFEGRLDAGTLPPMAAGGRTGPTQRSGPSTGGRGSDKQISYQTPEGWDEQPAGGMRQAAFSITSDEGGAEVTVIPLGPAAGDLLSNVNRWREQVGLERLNSVDEISAETVKIQGQEATYVQIDGAQDRGMLAAMLSQGGRIWFFKLLGDQPVVDQQQAAFRAFLASVRFES